MKIKFTIKEVLIDNQNRDFNTINKQEGTIVTFDSDEDEIIYNNFKIKIIPAYKFLLV